MANMCTKTVLNLWDSCYAWCKKITWDAKTMNNKPGSLRLLTLNNNSGFLRSTYLEQLPRLSEIYLPWTPTPVLWDLLTLNTYPGSLRSTYPEHLPRFSEIYLPWTPTPVLWDVLTLNTYPGSLRSTYPEHLPRFSEIYLTWTPTPVLWDLLTLNTYPGSLRSTYPQNLHRPAGPTANTARLSPQYEGKTRGCHYSHWAPDDGRENARNMLSCK